MITRELTITAIYGETDEAAAQADHLVSLAAQGVEVSDAPQVACDVRIVAVDADGGRLEMRFADWAEAAKLHAGASVTVTI